MSELPVSGAGENDPLEPKVCAEKLAALASPERLKILRFLRDGPHNVGEIADAIIHNLHGSKGTDGTVRYPGEQILKTRHENLSQGVPVNAAIWNDIREL